ncbi:hypothetical protein ISN76_14145 [Dyella halodurans]|uniref:Uncharacterized protein n=1 Tax=Dyella halodurans TaxID=1920171 RepID=A0ABV9C4Z9_9GAMM|nr:hypothetical protein [Dyella halodurans]
MNKVPHFLLLCLATTAGSLSALATPATYKGQAWVVGTYVSDSNEQHDAFVLRVAEALKTWTDQTGTEACGPIARTGDGRYYVQLTTLKAQIVCLRSTVMPEGMTYTGEDIHSHARRHPGSVTVTFQDQIAMREVGEERMLDNMRRLGIHVVQVDGVDFSEDDYAGGPGYLVVNETLRYQHGRGTSVKVADLNGPRSLFGPPW